MGDINDDTATKCCLLRLPEDHASKILCFLRLDDRARLAATCRALRTNERADTNQRSRLDRTNKIVERVKREERARILAEGPKPTISDAFLAAVEEFDGAGAMGAPGLLELIPVASTVRGEKLSETDELFGQPLITLGGQRRMMERRHVLRIFESAAMLWLPSLGAEELAREAAARLAEGGPLPADLKFMLPPNNVGVDAEEVRAACELERAELYKLGLLGRAAIPHLPTLFQKMIPRIPHVEDQDVQDEINGWIDAFVGLGPSTGRLWNISLIAHDALVMMKSSLTLSDVDILAAHIDPRLDENECPSSIAVSTLVLVKLWDLVQDHNIVQKALGQIPSSNEQVIEWFSGEANDYLVYARCELIPMARSTGHLDFLLGAYGTNRGLGHATSTVSLVSIAPLLSQSDRERMVRYIAQRAQGDNQVCPQQTLLILRHLGLDLKRARQYLTD